MTFGDWLRQKRDEFGYSNEEISSLLDINPSTWAKFMRNEKTVTPMHVMAFCHIFKEPKWKPLYDNLVPDKCKRRANRGKLVLVFTLDHKLDRKYISINEAARGFGVKPATIREWADAERVIFDKFYLVIEE